MEYEEDDYNARYGNIWGSSYEEFNEERRARDFLWSFLSRLSTAEHRLWIKNIEDINWPKANSDGSVDITVPVVEERTLTDKQLMDVWNGKKVAYDSECRCGLENIARERMKLIQDLAQLNYERDAEVREFNWEVYKLNSRFTEHFKNTGYYDEILHSNELNRVWQCYDLGVYNIDRKISSIMERQAQLENDESEIKECQKYHITNVRYLSKVKTFVVTVLKK